MIKKITTEYYVLTALSCAGHSIICATYVMYLLSHGLDLFQINMVNFAFFLTLFLAEIPTGAFADVFGRKLSFIVSCVLFSFGMLIYALSDTIYGFVTAEVVGAIGATFASGAFRAWFVDKLRHHGYTGKLDGIFARASQIGSITQIIFATIGAILADISDVMPWYAASFITLLCGFVAMFLKEEYFVRKKLSFKDGLFAMKQTVISSVRYGYRDEKVRFVLVLVTVQILAMQAPNMQWQPFFKQWLPNQTSLGFLFSAISISMMIGAWLAPKVLRKLKCQKKTLALFQIIIGLCIVVAAVFNSLIIAIIAFLLHEVARGAFGPIKDAYLHENIPSKERATIESFESLAHHFGGAIGLLLTGVIAKNFGISLTWIVSGLFLVLFTVLVTRKKIKQMVVK
jgi:MFS family permease